jgi:hypothetical protein
VVIRPHASPATVLARAGVLFSGAVAALFGRRIKQ